MKWIFNTLLLLIVILFFSNDVIGQKPQIDSLEKTLETRDIEDTVKVETLRLISELYISFDYNKSDSFAILALDLAKELDLPYAIADAYQRLGYNANIQGKSFEEVIGFYEKGLDALKEKDEKNRKPRIMSEMCSVYIKVGQHKKALKIGLETFELAKKNNDLPVSAHIAYQLGQLWNQREDYQKAKIYHENSLKYSKLMGYKMAISSNYNALGNIFSNINELDSAIFYYNKSLDVMRELGSEYNTIMQLTNIGNIYIKKKKYNTASKYFKEAYELAVEINNAYGKGSALSYLAFNYYYQKKYEKAVRYAEKGLKNMGDYSDIGLQSSFHEVLSLSYKETGNYKAAFQNLEQFKTLQDSIYNIDTEKKTKELETQYEVKQKETENQLLKAETQANKKALQSRNLLALALLLGLLLATSWGFVIYRSRLQTKKYNEILEQTVTERTKDLEQANYELRTFNYIASHDIKEPIRNIGSYVGLIRRKLPKDLKESLADYFDIIKRSSNQLYTLIEDFAYYSTLSKDEVIKTETVDLQLLTQNVIESLEGTIEKYNGQVVMENLPTIESTNSLLFTALKNLVENGLKYNQSETPTVKVSYHETETQHEIIVSDNGIGIEKQYFGRIFEMFKRLHNRSEYEGSGIGLAIVKLMAGKLGGEITVESEIGKGTQFTMQLPINKNN